MTATANPGGPPLPAINPDWLRKPSGDELADAFPPRALAEGIGGKASISCTVTIDGDLRDCRVVSEEPPGYGFGQAALEMASSFKMQPAIADGVQREGTVRIPIVFRKPEETAFTPFDPRMDPALMGAIAAAAAVAMLALLWLNDRVRRAPKAPLWPTLRAGAVFVGHAWLGAPLPLLAYLAAGMGQFYLAGADGLGAKWSLLGAIVFFAASLSAYGACYRLALRPAAPGRSDLQAGRFAFRVGIVEGRILATTLLVGVGLVGVAVLLTVAGVMAAFVIGHAPWVSFPDHPAVLAGVAIVGGLVLVYIVARLFPVFPAVVLRGEAGYLEAWRLSRAAVLTGFLAMVSQTALAIAPTELSAWAAEAAGIQHTMTAVWIVGAATMAGLALALPLYVGLTSHIYLTLRAQET